MKHLKTALLATLVLAAPSAWAQTVTLKFSAGVPTNSATFKDQFVSWMTKVEAASGGTIKFEVYGDGILAKVGETISAIGNGVADVGWDLPLSYGARFASLAVTGLPGLYTDPSPAAAALWRAYAAGKVGAELKDFKVIYLQTSTQNALYMKGPMKSNTDLTGVKMMTGSKERAEIIQTMNGVPVALSLADTYGALQKGVVDGVMTGVGAVEARKFDELTHYYVYGPFGGGISIMVMNKAKYDALPAQAKKAIDDNSGEKVSAEQSAWLRDYEDKYLKEKMLSVAGNKQVFMTAEEVAKWQPAFDKVVQSWIANTPSGQSVYDAFKAELAKK